MKDANGKVLNIGDKVHILGRASSVRYIIELGKTTAGIDADKNATSCNGVNYNRLVKFKNQDNEKISKKNNT